MKLNVAICDDEKIISKMIYSKLIDLRSEYSVDIYESGRCLLDSEKIYDLIFLDIEMPGIDGMKTAEQLRANSSGEFIIFLSNHTEFMPDAFKVKAFRFLSKPINDKDFIDAVLQAEKEILINEKISFSEKGCTMLIKIDDIVCVEAFGDGTFIHTVNEVIESIKSLKYWINQRSVPMKKTQFFKTSIFSYSSLKEVLLFIIGEVSVTVQLALSIYLVKNQFNWSGSVEAYFVLIACSIILAVICFLLISFTNKNHKLKMGNEISRNLLESQRKYYVMLLEKEEQTKAFRHDIRNHLYCMKALFDNEDYKSLGDYFNKFNIVLNDLDKGIHTGNNLIDVILNDINGKYTQTEIKWTGLLDENLKIDQPDLCTVFSNLLINAFEAADKCEKNSASWNKKIRF